MARVAFVCCALAILARWPAYETIPTAHPVYFVDVLDWQTQHPFQKLPLAEMVPPSERKSGFTSHLDKREMRQLLPLLGYVTGLHFKVYSVANHVAGFLFFVMLVGVLRRETEDDGISVLLPMAYALSYAGGHFFADYYLGDGVAIAFLLGAVATRKPLIIAACVAFAGMTDERAAVAALLPLVFWQIKRDRGEKLTALVFRLTPESRGVLAGLALALLWRVLLRWGFDLSPGVSHVAEFFILLYHAKNYPGNLLGIIGCLNVVFLCAAGVVYVRRGGKALALLGLAFAAAVFPAILVYDLQRSVAFGCVSVVIATKILARDEPQISRFVVLFSVVGNALLTSPIESVGRFMR